MNDRTTIILGAEYDQELRERLREILVSLGANIEKSSWGVGGSQELMEVDVSISGIPLRIEAETFIGLSIIGSEELVKKIQELVRRKPN